MMHYKKGKNVEEELSRENIPIEVLPDQFLWMQVKGGSAVMNLIEFAKKALEDGTHRSVVWSGSDGGVGKTVSCAEILKRHFELHQVTRICYRKVEEFWDPQEDGLDQIVAKRNIPCVHILMSLDAIDPAVAGYQHSKSPGGFWTGAGLGMPEGHQKRPQGQRTDRKGNYFTGPQLKKKPNRHYANGASEDNGGGSNGTNRRGGPQGPRDGGDGSRNKGKQKDRKKVNEGEQTKAGNVDRAKGPGGRRDKKRPGHDRNDAPGAGSSTAPKDASIRMDTSESPAPQKKDDVGNVQ